MAKMGGSNAGAPAMAGIAALLPGAKAAATGAPATSPRPQPRPDDLTAMMAQPPQPGLSGFLGPAGNQARYDMAMALLKGGMAGAQQSTSPLLQFLAPIAGAVIGSRAEAARGDYLDKTDDDLIAAMGGIPAGAQPYFDAMRNKDASPEVQALAKAKFEAVMFPKPVGGKGGGRGGGGTGTSRSGERLYDSIDIGGVLYGRTNDGRMVPYVGPDGQPMKSGAGSGGDEIVGEIEGADGLLYGRTKSGGLKPYLGPDGKPFKARSGGAASQSPFGDMQDDDLREYLEE